MDNLQAYYYKLVRPYQNFNCMMYWRLLPTMNITYKWFQKVFDCQRLLWTVLLNKFAEIHCINHWKSNGMAIAYTFTNY
jgi:hypothetical protein